MSASSSQKRYNYILNAENQGSSSQSTAISAPERKKAIKRKKREKVKEPGLRIFDGNIDSLFFVIVIVLLVFGIIMMFSASYIAGLAEGDGYKYVKTQGVAAIFGIFVMIFISFSVII